jgi:hypothetical protein
MAAYKFFGRRYVTAINDAGFNPLNNSGNWTATFSPDVMNLPQGQFEVTKGTISGGAPGAHFMVYSDAIQLDAGVLDAYGSATFYKGSDNEFIISGGIGATYLYFYFSDISTDGYSPVVTLWLAYDTTLDINQIGLR